MKNLAKVIFYIPFYNLLIFFAWLTNGSVGWSIVLLTVLIRLILLPSSLKAAKSATKLQALQPKMNEIREKHKGDQKKQNEEMMRLYKEEGASPFGSCLPLLIQLPILLILYRVFTAGLDTSRYGLLYSFTPHPETLQPVFMGINLAKPELWILPILAGVLQLVLSIMTMPKATKNKDGKVDPTQAMTKQMTYLFPIMTVFIGRSIPAALTLYWVITTLFGIGQQWYVNKKLKSHQSRPSRAEAEISNVKNEEKEPIRGGTKQIEERETKKEKPARSDLMTNIMKKRLNKQDRKKGVEITIRKK